MYMMFTNDMGFWTVDSMKENVHRATEENTTILEILPSIIDEEYFNMYEALLLHMLFLHMVHFRHMQVALHQMW
jgi:hypothetical protein